MVWYSHLFQNFPQFALIHIVKGFSVVNEAKVDVFLEFSCFFYDPVDVFPFSRGSSQPGVEPRSPTLQVDSLSAEPPGKSKNIDLKTLPNAYEAAYFKLTVIYLKDANK